MPPQNLVTTRLLFDAQRRTLRITCEAPGLEQPGRAVFVALNTDPTVGAAVVPFRQDGEGSTVFLPFRANLLYFTRTFPGGRAKLMRTCRTTIWSSPMDVAAEFTADAQPDSIELDLSLDALGSPERLSVAVYVKDVAANNGWGRMLAAADGSSRSGFGDQYVRAFYTLDVRTGVIVPVRGRTGGERVRIYQLLPRLFGNTNERRKPNGTLAENGVGKFSDINDAAIRAIKEMGFTHVWLTGVLRQATSTDYSHLGLPADDADLLKGLAGSPYAIKDYFDVCPDYAENQAERLNEFQALVARLRAGGLRVIIDFVPNHVARSYGSTVKPGFSFGASDDRTRFFDPQNNFYYLQQNGDGPPGLQLPTWKDGSAISPTCQVLGTCDGRFDPERDGARVTGNNVTSPEPHLHDWYETVKLNYGFDFTTGAREYPHGEHPDKPLPNTWIKMDHVLAHWQELGVDGFRCDMAHMVPPEFWSWAIGRARARQPGVLFLAEAYNNDPMKVPGGDPLLAALDDHRGNVMFDLLSAGFSAVYDDPSYKQLKSLYDGQGWANDLDMAIGHDFIFQNSLRYAENHDEVRLAAWGQWGDIGMEVGRAVTAILFGLSRGPVLLYSGQEVGEPAHGSEGFGGEDARTTIFDYWSMPELVKWVNGHRYDGAALSSEQVDLRAFYTRLVRLAGEPAFAHGEFYGLNPANHDNERFGRMPGEEASGHWLYAFLRSDSASGQGFLVLGNLNVRPLRDVRLRIPGDAFEFLGFSAGESVECIERLTTDGALTIRGTASEGLWNLGDIPPLTAFYFDIRSASTPASAASSPSS